MDTFTFHDTGRTVKIKKVSPFITNQLNQQFPPPPPPLEEVEYPNEKRMEPNENDPTHQAALKKWRREQNERAQELLLDRGVDVELGEAEIAEVCELRDWWLATYKQALGGEDKFVYVRYICIGTPEDINDVVQAITRRSGPTPEAEAEARARFRA